MRYGYMFLLVTALLMVFPLELRAQWTGPDMILNGDFDRSGKYWTESNDDWYYYKLGNSIRAWPDSVTDAWLRQTVSVTIGKRYQLRAGSTVGHDSSSLGRGRTQVSASGIAATSWWTSRPFGSTSFTYKTATGIASSSTTTVQLYWDELSRGGMYGCYFDDIELRQVIYAPQIDIGQSHVRINSDTPGSSTATVSLDLNDLSYADEPTSWFVSFGDGTQQSLPTLNSTHTHAYEIPAGDSYSWIASLNGSNQSGSASDLATVTVLRQPEVALLVNGILVQDNATIDIELADLLNLSLVLSNGYIEEGSFFINGLVDQVGSELAFSGTPFSSDDVWKTFTLTAGVRNTGAGINEDIMTVNLHLTPEPATMGLLALGGVALLKRRRRER